MPQDIVDPTLRESLLHARARLRASLPASWFIGLLYWITRTPVPAIILAFLPTPSLEQEPPAWTPMSELLIRSSFAMVLISIVWVFGAVIESAYLEALRRVVAQGDPITFRLPLPSWRGAARAFALRIVRTLVASSAAFALACPGAVLTARQMGRNDTLTHLGTVWFVLGGTLALVYFQGRFVFAPHFAQFESMGPLGALRASWRTTAGASALVRMIGFLLALDLVGAATFSCFLLGALVGIPLTETWKDTFLIERFLIERARGGLERAL